MKLQKYILHSSRKVELAYKNKVGISPKELKLTLKRLFLHNLVERYIFTELMMMCELQLLPAFVALCGGLCSFFSLTPPYVFFAPLLSLPFSPPFSPCFCMLIYTGQRNFPETFNRVKRHNELDSFGCILFLQY